MKLGVLKDLDDGIYRQAKTDAADAAKSGGSARPGVLLWLTDKVIDRYAETGKDGRGRDFDVQADLERHCSRILKKLGQADDGSLRAARAKAAAIEIYGVTRELAERGIRPEIDTGEKFFGVGAENSPLFPAYLASSFIVARLSAGLGDLLTFADVTVDRLSVDKVRLNEAEDARRMRNVGIGENLPITELSHVDTNVKMRKYGRLFRYAREVVRMTALMVVEAHVGQLARQVAIDETDEIVEILHAGDGETGSGVTDTTPATDGTLAYNDLITLELAFGNGYSGREFLAPAANFQTILGMSEYKDPLANRGAKRDRDIPNVPTPSGTGRIWRWSSTNSTYMAESGGRVLGVDPTMACYTARTALLEEQDSLIASGKQEVALSYMMAVLKGDPACTKSLDVTA